MRSNLRLLSSFILAMMLVNFHGNLIIRSQNLARKETPRQLSSTLYKIFRGIFWAFLKLALTLLQIFAGAMIIGLALALSWNILLPLPEVTWNLLCAGFALIITSFEHLADIQRVLYEDVLNDNLKFFDKRSRNLGEEPRQLSQGQPVQKVNEYDNLNLDEFTETTPKEVIQNNVKAGFLPGKAILKKTMEINQIELKLLTEALTEPQKQTLEAQKKTMIEANLKAKTEAYRARMRRIVVNAVKQHAKTTEVEMDPANLTGDKKKEFDKLVEKAKNKKPEDIKALNDYLLNSKDSMLLTDNKKSESIGGKFIYTLFKNGAGYKDAKSSYVLGLIGAAFTKLSEKKIQEAKKANKDQSEVADLSDSNKKFDLDQSLQKIKGFGNLDIADNTEMIAVKSNDSFTEDEEKELLAEAEKIKVNDQL